MEDYLSGTSFEDQEESERPELPLTTTKRQPAPEPPVPKPPKPTHGMTIDDYLKDVEQQEREQEKENQYVLKNLKQGFTVLGEKAQGKTQAFGRGLTTISNTFTKNFNQVATNAKYRIRHPIVRQLGLVTEGAGRMGELAAELRQYAVPQGLSEALAKGINEIGILPAGRKAIVKADPISKTERDIYTSIQDLGQYLQDKAPTSKHVANLERHTADTWDLVQDWDWVAERGSENLAQLAATIGLYAIGGPIPAMGHQAALSLTDKKERYQHNLEQYGDAKTAKAVSEGQEILTASVNSLLGILPLKFMLHTPGVGKTIWESLAKRFANFSLGAASEGIEEFVQNIATDVIAKVGSNDPLVWKDVLNSATTAGIMGTLVGGVAAGPVSLAGLSTLADIPQNQFQDGARGLLYALKRGEVDAVRLFGDMPNPSKADLKAVGITSPANQVVRKHLSTLARSLTDGTFVKGYNAQGYYAAVGQLASLYQKIGANPKATTQADPKLISTITELTEAAAKLRGVRQGDDQLVEQLRSSAKLDADAGNWDDSYVKQAQADVITKANETIQPKPEVPPAEVQPLIEEVAQTQEPPGPAPPAITPQIAGGPHVGPLTPYFPRAKGTTTPTLAEIASTQTAPAAPSPRFYAPRYEEDISQPVKGTTASVPGETNRYSERQIVEFLATLDPAIAASIASRLGSGDESNKAEAEKEFYRLMQKAGIVPAASAQAPTTKPTPTKPIPPGLISGEAGTFPLIIWNPPESVVKEAKAGVIKSKEWLLPQGLMPEPIFDELIQGRGRLGERRLEVDYAIRDFRAAVYDAYGTKKVSIDDSSLINTALHNPQEHLSKLPPQLQPTVAKLRDDIDALSIELLNSGAIEGDILTIIDKNLGVYLHRSYRVFDDPEWSNRVDDRIKNAAKNFIRKEYQNYTDDQIEHTINALLYVGKDSDSPMAALAKAKLGRKDLSILLRRKDIPEEIRTLWGEYTDPLVNYVKSVEKLGRLIENHKTLTEIRQVGLDNGLFFTDNTNPEAYVQIAKGDYSMEPVAGLWTTPETKQAINETFGKAAQISEAQKWLARAMAGTKISKTALSWVTHTSNLAANHSLMIANGHFDFTHAAKAFAAAGLHITGTDKGKWRDYILDAVREGIIGEEVGAEDIRSVVSQLFITPVEATLGTEAAEKPVGRAITATLGAVKKTYETALELYKWGDAIPKLIGWEVEKAEYRKARPDLSEAEIKTLTAKIIRNQYPSNAMLSKLAKTVRHWPLFGPFVSFSAEMIRVPLYTYRQAGLEIVDPRTRIIGMKRAYGSILAHGILTSSLAQLFRYFAGVDKDEEEKLRHHIAPWSKNSQLVHLGKDEDSLTYDVIDLSRWTAHSNIQKTAIAFLRGANWKDAMWEASKEAFRPFISEEILAGKYTDIMRNKKATGGTVYNEEDDAEQIAIDVLKHMWDAFEPGTLTSLKRVKQGWEGYVSPSGKKYDFTNEAIAASTGVRLTTIDIPQSYGYKASRYQSSLVQANKILLGPLHRRGTVTPEEIADSYQRMERNRKRLFDEYAQVTRDTRALGLSDKKTRAILKENQLTEDSIDSIMTGVYRPYIPSTLPDLLKILPLAAPEHKLELQQAIEDKATTVINSAYATPTSANKKDIAKAKALLAELKIPTDQLETMAKTSWAREDNEKLNKKRAAARLDPLPARDTPMLSTARRRVLYQLRKSSTTPATIGTTP